MKKYSFYLLFALLVIVFDQLSKLWMIDYLSSRTVVNVGPFLQWTLVYNTGAAFGFLHNAGGVQYYIFPLFAIAASIFLLIWIWQICQHKMPPSKVILAFALCLILAGALGNLIDRIRFGYVVDFINLHYHQWYFPAFNIADTSITIGAILLLYDAFFQNDKD